MLIWRDVLHPIFVSLNGMRIRNLCLAMVLSAGTLALAQVPAQPAIKNGPRATLISETNLYIQPDVTSQRIAMILPGREIVIMRRSGQWIQVFANVDSLSSPEDQDADTPSLDTGTHVQPLSGWMLSKGVVDSSTPNGDRILFGQADIEENAASQSNPPPHAALEARLLYMRVVQMFPKSPLVPDAMWRAADIRWQLQKATADTLPSSHQRQPYLRELMDENEMKDIQRYFPNTKWAAFAAYDMIDNKLCGDWQGSEKCPEKEAGYYEKYVEKYPNSPRNPQALYKAVWRLASAGDMWVADGNMGRAKSDRDHAAAVAAQLESKYPNSVYADRAAALIYKMQSGIAIYGGGNG